MPIEESQLTSRARFLAAARAEGPLDRAPVWIMRQAGRYLPEYRKLKEAHSFLELVKTPELAAEVTLQPLKRFPLDAAVIFSDILIVPEALGQPYHFRDEGGIGMDFALRSAGDIARLGPAEQVAEKLRYLADALLLVRRELPGRALLGFCGSPWTLAVYMVEGGSARTFSRVKALFHEVPAAFEALMEKLCEALTRLLNLQIQAGADAVQLFDSWAALCPHELYWDLSLRWIQQIIAGLPPHTPTILYAKSPPPGQSESMLATGVNALSVDWTRSLPELRAKLGPDVALQGNLDPAVLTMGPEAVARNTRVLVESMRGDPGWICNLGHGITPDARIDAVETFLETVHTAAHG